MSGKDKFNVSVLVAMAQLWYVATIVDPTDPVSGGAIRNNLMGFVSVLHNR